MERRALNHLVKIEKMHISRDPDNPKAYVSLVVANTFIITNIRVVEGPYGLYVAMPSEKQRVKHGEERIFERAFPVTRKLRHQITDLVLGEYRKRLQAAAC